MWTKNEGAGFHSLSGRAGTVQILDFYCSSCTMIDVQRLQMTQRYKVALVGFVLIAGLFIFYRTKVEKDGDSKIVIPSIKSLLSSCQRQLHDAISANRRCLLEQTVGPKLNIWTALNPAVHNCTDKIIWNKLNVHTLLNGGDIKFMITPTKNSGDISCTEVTLGVGGDIQAERQLLKFLPHCKLYGADPILQSGKVFGDIGKYFQIAVSDKAGVFKASVLENGRYRDKDVETVDLMDFIKNRAKLDRIDHFFMDNEGAEYKIIPKFLIRPEITICQLSMEMHGKMESYGTNDTEFNKMMTPFLESSPFLPIWSAVAGNWGPHYRLFLINVNDPYCLEKYIIPKVCPN